MRKLRCEELATCEPLTGIQKIDLFGVSHVLTYIHIGSHFSLDQFKCNPFCFGFNGDFCLAIPSYVFSLTLCKVVTKKYKQKATSEVCVVSSQAWMDTLALRSKVHLPLEREHCVFCQEVYPYTTQIQRFWVVSKFSPPGQKVHHLSLWSTHSVLPFPEASAAFPFDRRTCGNEHQLLPSQSRGKTASSDPASHFFSRLNQKCKLS